MNRLIILGNGFDLAHGLPTQYSDFIKNYWNSIKINAHTDELFSMQSANSNIYNISANNFEELLKEINVNYDDFESNSGTAYFSNPKFINKFFHILNKNYNDTNWANIEIQYYKELKKILENPKSTTETVKEFNLQVAAVVIKFEKYLIDNVKTSDNNIRIPNLFSIIKNGVVTYQELNNFYREFPKSYVNNKKNALHKYDELNTNRNKLYNQTLFLNFNYTNTLNNYIPDNNDFQVINIHGELGNKNHPINLGFGDEMDKFYSKIEESDNNEYLRFIKSFHYTNTGHYKDLMDFIDSYNFQLQIMGHSCGLSDRTLLNHIFEHTNCKSIKVFYHEWEDNNKKNDNYSEIVKNISRHFNKKTMMREKIVNKTFCEPLPQLKKV